MEIIKIRNDGLDKFYTNIDISTKCINTTFNIFDIKNFDLIIEPSSGNGSFLLNINSDKKIGIDIMPEHNDIIKMDFFSYIPNKKIKNILTIGNPPFGKNCSMAIKFFNHASLFSNIIAFIIPKTFRKISIQNKLNKKFNLIYDEDIPLIPCSFTPKMMVKCCFQIWKKTDIERQIIKMPIIHNDFYFIKFGEKDKNNQPTPPKNADFAIRAYGGNCGEIKTTKLNELRPKSWHWIKSNIDIDLLILTFNKLDYKNSLNTARQNSLGKAELIKLYVDFINSKI